MRASFDFNLVQGAAGVNLFDTMLVPCGADHTGPGIQSLTELRRHGGTSMIESSRTTPNIEAVTNVTPRGACRTRALLIRTLYAGGG